jgi:hypothetical protein
MMFCGHLTIPNFIKINQKNTASTIKISHMLLSKVRLSPCRFSQNPELPTSMELRPSGTKFTQTGPEMCGINSFMPSYKEQLTVLSYMY